MGVWFPLSKLFTVQKQKGKTGEMVAPNVNITIITYRRPVLLQRVIQSIIDNVAYPLENIHFIISFDELEPERLPHIPADISHEFLFQPRLGMGGNWNAAIARAEEMGDYTLCCQDDWLFTSTIKLRLGIEFLHNNPQYGMVRYHKLTGHCGLLAVMQEWDTSNVLLYDAGENEYVPYMLPFMELLPAFGDTNTYSPYSGGVHLRHKRFTDFFGQYPVGKDFSRTELEYQYRVNKTLRENLNIAPRIAIFPRFIVSRFRDLAQGSSYRLTEIERETLA